MGLHLQLHKEAPRQQERYPTRSQGRHYGSRLYGRLCPTSYSNLSQVCFRGQSYGLEP